MTTRAGIPSVDVLGVRVAVLTPERLVDDVLAMVRTGIQEYVTFTGVHGVMESVRNPSLLAIHNRAAIVAPDGMPMVWAGRRAGIRGGSRCYGPDCMVSMCALAAREDWPVFLYGGKPGVPELLGTRLVEMVPGLTIAGTHSPPFRTLTDDEVRAEIALINGSGARLVFVGLSTPKQEVWMSERVGHIDANVLFGVGAAFDFHTGLVRQAPQWMQRMGLEWLFRVCMEPRRLAGRYLRNNPAFVARILRRPPVSASIRPDRGSS